MNPGRIRGTSFPSSASSSCARHLGTFGNWQTRPKCVRLETGVSRMLNDLVLTIGIPSNPKPEDFGAHARRIHEAIPLLLTLVSTV